MIRNIGLVAHVDAGKTTTTEQMLFCSGSIRHAGRVDDGTTQTDYLQVERERGISVRAAATVLPWKGCQINLVDTPGHTDFISEVERSLRILDGAVLVISAAEGVQSHTETLWHALRALDIPTLLFVNKLDRFGADPARVLAQIRERLTDRAMPVQAMPAVEHDLTAVAPLNGADLLERLAELDDGALERYLSDGLPEPGWAEQRLAALCLAGQAFPVFFGSSLKGIGVAELLDGVLAYLPPPRPPEGAPLSALVFKVERDPVMGRLAYVRLYGGVLENRQPVLLPGRSEPVRVAQLRKRFGRHHATVNSLEAGDIGVACGLGDVRAGDVIGDPTLVPPLHRMAVPVLRVGVHPAAPQELSKLLGALHELADEDPYLAVDWQPEVRELHVTMMGPIQAEILAMMLRDRFGLTVRMDPPAVIYRETPVNVGEGEVTFTLFGWAYVKVRVEPGEPGSGLQFVNQVLHDDLYPNFAAEVGRTVPKVLAQGLRGWEVTDARVCLVGGAFDSIVTTVGNYSMATPMAVMSALAEAGTRLLEPLYTFRLSVPATAVGKVMGELVQMRAVIAPPIAEGDRLVIAGTVPVATAMAFPARLSGLTGGRGIFTTQPGCYQPAPEGVQATRQRVGVDPLDRSRYLLSLAKAIG